MDTKTESQHETIFYYCLSFGVYGLYGWLLVRQNIVGRYTERNNGLRI